MPPELDNRVGRDRPRVTSRRPRPLRPMFSRRWWSVATTVAAASSCWRSRAFSFVRAASFRAATRAGGTIDCRTHSRRMVFARSTVATERQGGFSPAEGPSPDASVTW